MRIVCVVVQIFTLFLAAETAYATSFVNRPLEDVIEESAMIVRGRTGSSKAEWGKDDQQRVIYTFTTLDVTDIIRNRTSTQIPNTITLRQPGGSADGVEMHVPGTASFSEDQDVVVLLAEKNKDGSYDVPGLVTGVYTVKTDGDETYLENNLGGEAIYDPHKGADTQSYNARIPLSVFKKIAQGAKNIPQAKAKQFAESHDHPKEGAFEGDHAEQEKIQKKIAQAKMQSAENSNNDQKHEDKSSAVPIVLSAVITLAFGTWLISRKRGSG